MVRALRSVVTVLDRVSSRVLGVDGAVRNARHPLDDHRLALARIAALEQRIAPLGDPGALPATTRAA